MDFVRIADFNNRLQAETVAHLLDAENIPFNIHSNDVIYGEGGVGPYVFLSVPAEQEAKARGIIEGAAGVEAENV